MSYVSMGDVLCFEGDCEAGETAVAQLKAMFAASSASVQDRFRPSYAAIIASYDQAQDSWTRRMPFTSVCCQIKDIGAQATALANQIAEASNIAPIPPRPSSGSGPLTSIFDGLNSAAKTAGVAGQVLIWGAVIFGGVWAYNNFLRKR